MSSEPANLIQFFCAADTTDPAPFPAVQAVPEWLKKMPQDTEVPRQGTLATLKRCAPFVEAMTGGYIIPLRGPIRFTLVDQHRLQFDHLDYLNTGDIVMGQSPYQYDGAPFDGVIKFVNNWIVKTPPGYSCLFLPVMNQASVPFHLFSGVVETDTWFRPVHFPGLCTMQAGTQITLPKGTPLAQVIPFKREAWRSESGAWDPKVEEVARRALQRNIHVYREEHWQKKEFR